jgi:NAD-specific glutamate dehydrogenase
LPNEKEIVDHYGSDEILFLGPDEGTADVMQWACDYAKERGYVNGWWGRRQDGGNDGRQLTIVLCFSVCLCSL